MNGDALCAALESFGIENTKFELIEVGSRPLCYTVAQPYSFEDEGYQFEYRVISNYHYDVPESVFASVQGKADQILCCGGRSRLVEMFGVILDRLELSQQSDELMHKLRTVEPDHLGYARSGPFQISISYRTYAAAGLQNTAEIRFDIRSLCSLDPDDLDAFQMCVSKHRGNTEYRVKWESGADPAT